MHLRGGMLWECQLVMKAGDRRDRGGAGAGAQHSSHWHSGIAGEAGEQVSEQVSR